jgi:hypothetical protein
MTEQEIERMGWVLRHLASLTLVIASRLNINPDTTGITLEKEGQEPRRITLRGALDEAFDVLGMKTRVSDMEVEGGLEEV